MNCAKSVLGTASILLLGCGIADQGRLPPDVQDPASVQTAAGAVAFYQKTVSRLPSLFDRLAVNIGIMTDELSAMPLPDLVSGEWTLLDSRTDWRGIGALHADELHRLRAQAREARGFVNRYIADLDTSIAKQALTGHLYALEGYAEIFLADLFCSGIPLSTVDFAGNYTLRSGSSTLDVYRHAVTLFDSALSLTADSLRLRHFAVMGRARALLAIGDPASVDSAATAVGEVPDDYVYQAVFRDSTPGVLQLSFANYRHPDGRGAPRMADYDGEVGLDFRSSNDPRTPVAVPDATPDQFNNIMFLPTGYPTTGPITFIVTSGIEARLIEIEAALRRGDAGWIDRINLLRRTAGLADTADPGTSPARVNLLFRERAFWLYLTAHRQGDLRRLVRQYGRLPSDVYPSRGYKGGNRVYGDKIVVPMPRTEQDFNPKYTGCINENA